MIRYAGFALLMAALEVLGAASLRADTLFNNLGQTAWGNIQVGFGHFTGTDFVTGGSATTITGGTVRLVNQDNIPHSMTLSLWSDSGSGTPDALVGSFDPVNVPATAVFNSYSLSTAGIELDADTAYWLIIHVNENFNVSGVGWQFTNSHAADAGSVFSLITDTQMQYSEDGGETWIDNFDFEFQFELLPEPGRFAQLGAGLLLLGLLRWRRGYASRSVSPRARPRAGEFTERRVSL